MMHLAQVRDATHGQLFGEDVFVSGVSTDSRSDCTGKLFVALSGENFDAHDFVPQARQQGAVASLLERKLEDKQLEEMPTVIVDDTLVAFGALAAWWRSQFNIPVVGITGSVGKTTIKEMLAAIFTQTGTGLVTQGNLNNEIGVPLTLLRMTSDDNYAIVEMGMNHAGEIARLTEMTKPNIALISNAAAAHLQGLGSVEAVAEAKGEIFQGLDDGVAIINLDDQYASRWLELAGDRKVITFGLSELADITATYQLAEQGTTMHVCALTDEFELKLPLPGKHNVSNALAAIAVAVAAEVSINDISVGIKNCQSVAGRLNVQQIDSLTLIDDTYNANPASMRAAIDVLATYSEHTFIMGDMGELGEHSEAGHREIGTYAAQQGINRLYACGVLSKLAADEFQGESFWFETQNELIKHLESKPIISGACLVKGSRAAKMERVVATIRDSLNRGKAKDRGFASC